MAIISLINPFCFYLGEVGICLDVYDAESLTPHEFGSNRFLILTLMDMLYDYMSNLSLDTIKGGFERRRVLEGVIFQKVYQGLYHQYVTVYET